MSQACFLQAPNVLIHPKVPLVATILEAQGSGWVQASQEPVGRLVEDLVILVALLRRLLLISAGDLEEFVYP